jgi:hypothetical protein
MDERLTISNIVGGLPQRWAPSCRAAKFRADAPPALTFQDAMATWILGLKKHAAAIRACMREAEGAGRRILGTQWAQAGERLDAAEGELAASAGELATIAGELAAGEAAAAAGELAGGLASRMAAADTAVGVARALGAAAAAALDPNVQAAALASMSHTYSDNLKGLARGVREAGHAAQEQCLEAGRAAAAAGREAGGRLEAADIKAAYEAAPGRGTISTELYVSALLRWACRQGGDGGNAAAVAALEAAKGSAFGLAADTPASAEADTAALAEYHPLQAMAFAPAGFTDEHELAPAGAPGARPAVDVSLPQARLTVVYDLAPLVDRHRALAYGPLASTVAGLNFRLVERLRTIRAAPFRPVAPAAADAAAARPALLATPLTVTTDGRTGYEFAPRVWTQGAAARGDPLWAPFAGGRPRAAAHLAAEAAVILAAIRAGRAAGWRLELRAEYEAAVRSEALPTGECGEESLLAVLLEEFEKVYDAAPPEYPSDFRGLVAPPAPAPGDYFCAAAGRIAGGALDEQLRALHFKPAAAPVPHAVAVRELRVSQAIQTVETGRKLWKRFGDAFRPDAEAFSQPPPLRKVALMGLFRTIALKAIRVGPVVCAPPSLKGYAIAAPRAA